MKAIEWRDLGRLRRIDEFRWNGAGVPSLLALRLAFERGSATIEANEDDTVAVAHPEIDPVTRQDWADPVDASDSAPWTEVLGSAVLWARRMTNHHGWDDGIQFEFALGDDSVGTCVDIIAVASGLRVGQAQFGS